MEQPPSYNSLQPGAAAGTSAACTSAAFADVRYVQVAASQHCAYFVRSDGLVDRTTGGGKITQQMVPPASTKYIHVAADQHASYLLTDNGVIHRTTSGGKVSASSVINPPPGAAYVTVSSGPIASYFVLSNGSVMRSLHGGAIDSVMAPQPAGVKYVDASAGMVHTYLLRDDGLVDKVKGGNVIATISPQGRKGTCGGPGTVTFVGLGQQLTVSSDKESHGPFANYLQRSDGLVERVTTRYAPHQLLSAAAAAAAAAAGIKKGELQQHNYLNVSAGGYCSYLIRDDGVCCRTVHNGRIQKEMVPEKGTRYVQAAAGVWSSYVLRSDGAVVRTVTGGNVNKIIFPAPRQARLERLSQHNC